MSCLTEVSLVHGWQQLSSCRQHQKRPVCLFRAATAISESLKARELCSKSGRKLPVCSAVLWGSPWGAQGMSDAALTGSQTGNARHWEDKPNAGYSGTPMWKIKAQLQEQQANAQAGPRKVPEGFKQVEKGRPLYYNDKRQVYWNSDDGQTYVYDAVMQKYSLLYDGQPHDVRFAVGACFHEKASQVRHVLVKDLAKAAQFSHVRWHMPRSAASSSEVDRSSSSSSGTSEQAEQPLYDSMAGPPHPPQRSPAALEDISDTRLELTEHSRRSLAWLQNTVLRFFCWQTRRLYMEEVLRQPQRPISSTVAAWGRTQHELPAEAVLDRTMAHLDATTAETLRANFSCLKELLQRRPARNDRAWILTTGNQHCPDKQRLQQQLRLYVLEKLRQRLPEPLALEAADTFANMAMSLWYQDFLTAMFPWLTAEEQLQFQQWFQDYEWNQYLSLPPSAAAPARMDETGDEVDRSALPRGSMDPVPPPPPS
ncbi:hypothetical protein AK812_SmicGene27784 [Symbiodinium microadriaticum]|uniref:Uncharacterized protein n=1 Tax=Symbiodinium microadriaticum TaxID=2951 RepID=A0A1Q9D648_SYMMI|nr:hypothetical protein AK812_SmicGene27784 [Symbiodinium microadriaticum]